MAIWDWCGGPNMFSKTFKVRLKSGEPLLGTVISTPEPDIAEFMSTLGFDWFWIDMEHCPLEIKSVQTILQAIRGSDVASLVRVPWNDPVYIKRVLDLGPDGVIIPWVNSRTDAENAIRYCMYPPKGIRGCGPRRPVWFRVFTEYVTRADEEVVIVTQIETREALENIRGILSVKGLDATMIGPADLSASLGFLGNPKSPVVTEAIKRILEAHKGTDVVPGIFSSADDAGKYLEMGFKLICIGSDLDFLARGAKEALNKIKKA
ncbi:MAG: aldolase/citrate lyase family protein [Candidatus Bathyarchaeia archaeon]